MEHAASDSDLKGFFGNLPQFEIELGATFSTRKVAPSTAAAHKRTEKVLRSFLEKSLAAKNSKLTAANILKRGADFSMIDRVFWKLSKNDSIKEKDLKVFAIANGNDVDLQVHVTFRFLKGMRDDESKYRTAVLYSDRNLEPALDPTLLLLTILLDDNAFEHFSSWGDIEGFKSQEIQDHAGG
ncbi:unnamed protein product [Tilletia laevis]|uniref:Uncharacterized protein n=1 Tax=Tilletia laevis TaxID=157183 RepID=A0A9N8M106_9BASI|nr:unnamed protein product [Tilletia laevis]CAD6957356.1 unnamed protein product [Tilletia laevis]